MGYKTLRCPPRESHARTPRRTCSHLSASPSYVVPRTRCWRLGYVDGSVRAVHRRAERSLYYMERLDAGSVRSNRSELTRTSPEGLRPPTAQWLEVVRCSRTFPTSLKTALEACFPFHHSGSRRFAVVEPPRTHAFLPASPFVTVIQGGSVFLNLPELTRTFPVGLLPPSSQWFEVVQ